MPQNKNKAADDVCEVWAPDDEKIEFFAGNIPELGDLAELFNILGEETRAKIIFLLSRQELCVCDIAALLQSSVSNISHHLRVLRSARLVKYRRDGRKSIYSLEDQHVLQLFSAGLEHVQHLDE